MSIEDGNIGRLAAVEYLTSVALTGSPARLPSSEAIGDRAHDIGDRAGR